MALCRLLVYIALSGYWVVNLLGQLCGPLAGTFMVPVAGGLWWVPQDGVVDQWCCCRGRFSERRGDYWFHCMLVVVLSLWFLSEPQCFGWSAGAQ